MIGSILGGALKLGSTIFGGISASKAMRNVRKNIAEQQRRNQAWYDRNMNEDVTQRADAQRVLQRTQELMRERSQAAAGTQAVMGGTEESAAASKAANSEALAEAASQVAASGERRRDEVERQYMANDMSLNGQLNQMDLNKAGQIAQAVRGAGQTGADIADNFNF